MELVLGSLGKIKSLNYLTVENCERYRAICAFAYHQFTNFSNQFSKEEVLFFLKKDKRFEEYTETMLDSDLAKLVEWNNLVAIQDKTDVRTISEFKLKRFRYQCSEETVEIERSLQGFFEKKKISTATLEKNMIEMLVAELEKLNQLQFDGTQTQNKEFSEVVYRYWKELEIRSKALRDNTQDFFNHVNSDAFDKMTNSAAFIPFKDRFLAYLNEFVSEVKKHSYKIRSLIAQIDEKIEFIVDYIYDYLMDIPLMDNEIEKKALMSQWYRLRNWFVSGENYTSNFELLEILTTRTIERIYRIVNNLRSNLFNNRNRSSDYRTIAKLFYDCDNDSEAQELSRLVFGFDSCKAYYFADQTVITTESDNLPVIGDVENGGAYAIAVTEIKKRKKGEVKTRTKTINKEEQELKKQEQRLLLQQQREEFGSLIKEGRITLKETIFSPTTLRIALNLVSSLIQTRKQTKKDNITIRSDYGNVSLVVLSDEQILIKATHGTLSFKDYQLVFGG